ncbi:MAG: hypothetical protein CMM78_10495 [Rhodospirillaceae bacterium]|nr:hypothetical protein [Rhodospirillales bacterium]MAX48626.1 hypothetical protein [Rhodospirillaceae bacterium]|tara:strand:- start:64000 stop:65133 length:1134 start_codon:yes stop_codon:yes gene_type:complete
MKDVSPCVNRHALPRFWRQPKFWRLSGGTVGLAALMLSTMLTSAQAQQAYFRGEANSNDSVTVNLSVIDKLKGGPAPLQAPSFATPAAPPVISQTAPPKPMSTKPQPAPAAGLAPPPSQAPQSTLLVPNAPSGSGNSVAATPPPVPSLPLPKPAKAATPAPTPASPPPKPQIAAEPAPKPAVPQPAPEAPPASTIEAPQTAAVEPSPAPAPTATQTEEQAATPAPASPPPAPAITPEPAPAQSAPAQPAAAEEPQVASVDLTAVDSSGVMKNNDGLSVLFSRDSQDLPSAAETALAELAEELKGNESLTLKLLGYSEPIGEAQSKPRRLSLFRALAVRTYLLKQGIDSRRMTVQALGTKDESPDRPKNRVDLIVSGA